MSADETIRTTTLAFEMRWERNQILYHRSLHYKNTQPASVTPD